MATPTLVQKARNSSAYSTTAVTVSLPAAVTAGNALIIAVEGAKITDPYSVGQVAGSASVTSAPVIKDNNNHTYNLANGNTNASLSQINFDGDLGYYSTVYLYYAYNVTSGIKTFTISDLDANGRPTFNHGLNVQVYEFSGINTTPLESAGSASATSAANPAVGGAVTTTATGDFLFLTGHVRKASSVSLPSGFTLLDTGRVTGTANDYYVTGYSNGIIGVETATITNIAIGTNVLTVTAANTFLSGDSIVLSGLTTNTFLNGKTVVATSGDGTAAATFTASYTHADVLSVSDTGTAVGGPALLPIGATNPGFINPSRYKVGVVTLALKHA